jgi:hypothetical protein
MGKTLAIIGAIIAGGLGIALVSTTQQASAILAAGGDFAAGDGVTNHVCSYPGAAAHNLYCNDGTTQTDQTIIKNILYIDNQSNQNNLK